MATTIDTTCDGCGRRRDYSEYGWRDMGGSLWDWKTKYDFCPKCARLLERVVAAFASSTPKVAT